MNSKTDPLHSLTSILSTYTSRLWRHTARGPCLAGPNYQVHPCTHYTEIVKMEVVLPLAVMAKEKETFQQLVKRKSSSGFVRLELDRD